MSRRASNSDKHQQRLCLVCRKRTKQSDLIRLVFSQGSLAWDELYKVQSRGAYLHRECAGSKQAFDVRRWGHALRVKPECMAQLAKELAPLLLQFSSQ